MFLKPKSLVFEPFCRLLRAVTLTAALLTLPGPVLPAFAHGDLDLQISAMTQAIAAEPGNAELYLRRAELHRIHADWMAAQIDIDRARELAPDLPTSDLVQGRLFFDVKRFQGAEEALDRFLKRVPNHVDALVTRARVRNGSGQYLKAADDFAGAISNSRQPEPDYYIEEARSLAAAGQDHIPQAIAALDAGMMRLGKLVTLGLCAVELECARRNFDAALERLESLSANQARKEVWHERRGDVLSAAGRMDDARAAYQAGLDAIKVLPPYIQNTGAVQQRQERLSDKLKELASARTP